MDDVGLASHSTGIQNPRKEIAIEIPENLETTFRPEECIYKAPAALRMLNEAAYTPRVISIGPIHHGVEELKPMEIQKQRYLKEFCKRLGVQKEEQERAIFFLRPNQEDEIRRRYAANAFDLCSDKFVKMILLDAVFIFELFLRNKESMKDKKAHQNDFIMGKPWLRGAIQRDLILLENQLPFSFLEELYNTLVPIKANCRPFLKLSCQYFKKYDKINSKPTETLHFTDLVRYFLSVKHPKLSPDEEPIKNLYSATMMHQAGIKFKPSRNECLLDIRAWDWISDSEENGDPVKKGELHIPPLEIDNSTECLFRNLMALEQCHYPRDEYICRYVKLLDFLVDIEKDVDLLIENKVIVSRLGDSKAVATLINRLCLEIEEVPSSYYALSKLLNEYYESSWNKNKAYLISVYFKNVWIGTGTVFGLIILAITVTRFIMYFFR